MEAKRISVSSKRQITIPLSFYQELDIGDEVDCILEDGVLHIKPVPHTRNGEFAEEILSDLISLGLSGDALMQAFRQKNKGMRGAVEKS